jgi:hypothetical protein
MSSKINTEVSKTSQRWTSELGENDVLLGRGKRHPGNAQFYRLCRERKAKYVSSSRRDIKAKIAYEIYNVIASNNGKFVREITASTEAATFQHELGTRIFVEVEKAAAYMKIKHTLRDDKTKALHNVRDNSTANGTSFELMYAPALATTSTPNTQRDTSINEQHELVVAQPATSSEHQNTSGNTLQPVAEFSSELSHIHVPQPQNHQINGLNYQHSLRSIMENINPINNQSNYTETTRSTTFRPSEVSGSLVTAAISILSNIINANQVDSGPNHAILAYIYALTRLRVLSNASRLFTNSNDIIGLVFDPHLNIESIFQVPLTSILAVFLPSDRLNNVPGISNTTSSDLVPVPSRDEFIEHISNPAMTNNALGRTNLSGNPS